MSKNDKVIENNSEILFIYDAKMCNPNGDPDDENKPRMDYDRNQNIVSDVRLKRYIRDYIFDYRDSSTNKIFVSKIDGASVNAKKSVANILKISDSKTIKLTKEQAQLFIDRAIDVRMFGGVIPDVKFHNNSNATYTGPIQFNWGYSLNKVTGPFDSSGITSHFQTGKSSEGEEGTKTSGAMGKDYKVAYSIIAFHGIISAKRAELYQAKDVNVGLTNADLKLFDRSMIRAIPLESTTRSKGGQEPLLYMRVEYNSNDYFIGDLRKYLKLSDQESNLIPFEKSDKLDRGKYKIDVTDLMAKLKSKKSHISRIHYWTSDDIQLKGFKTDEKEINFQEINLEKENDEGNQDEQ